MAFDDFKKNIQIRNDKSRKNQIDSKIIPLVNLLNSCSDFQTTSSCSGRIIILTKPLSGRKDKCVWLFVAHNKTTSTAVKNSLLKLPKEDVWFKFESFIIHIACRNLDAAKNLLQAANACGLKHSGMISVGKRYLVEIIGTEYMSTLISKKGMLIASEPYLRIVVNEANRKMHDNSKKISRFYKEIKRIIK